MRTTRSEEFTHEARRLRVETIPPAQMPEVLRVAADLYAREQSQIAEVEQRRHLLEAAAEVGLPAEYLERAAAIVAEQQAGREKARRLQRGSRRRLRWLMAQCLVVGLAASVLGHWMSRPSMNPATPVATPVVAPISTGASVTPVPLIGPCTEVDLSPYATQQLDGSMLSPGNDLRALLAGLREDGISHRILDGVPFRLDGLVLVGPGEAFNGDGVRMTVAPQVEGIAIDRAVKRLHFLQGTHWRAQDGAEIGAYIVHYADGTRLEIPIRYGEDVRDWWVRSDPNPQVARARVAWRGSNEAADRHRSQIRLYMSTWENPYPERTIRNLDMVTGPQAASREAPVPFLVGLTLEHGRPARAGSSELPPGAAKSPEQAR
jgi:hypothetical protein